MKSKSRFILLVSIVVISIVAVVVVWRLLSPAGTETSMDPAWDIAAVEAPPGNAAFREVVGPAGNPYADPEFYNESATIPVAELPVPVLRILEAVVPGYKNTQIESREIAGDTRWRILAETSDEDRYLLTLSSDGFVWTIRSSVSEVRESQGTIFHAGGIREIGVDEVPESVKENAGSLAAGFLNNKAYSVDAEAGRRYFLEFERERASLIISLTEQGEIRAAGQAAAMLRPITPRKSESLEEIAENLSKYGAKYYVDTLIERIKDVRFRPSQGFRFVVLGDSRSNLEVWQAIVYSVNQWEPLFVIDVGDLTPAGHSTTLDQYHLATLEQYTGYPYLPIMGNHDCGEILAYEYAFGGDGSRVYHYDYGKCRFVILDNSTCIEGMPWEDQLALADTWLSEKKKFRKFVFIHLPPSEVEKWAYHAMSPEMSAPFVSMMSRHEVDHVFVGHIHAYSTATLDGVDYTITGGAGAGLHEQYGELGSHHHYLVVDVKRNGIDMQLVRLLPTDR